MTRLPKAENAIIAEHEAGKHNVYNGGYSTKGPQPETCRECAKRAKAEAAGDPSSLVGTTVEVTIKNTPAGPKVVKARKVKHGGLAAFLATPSPIEMNVPVIEAPSGRVKDRKVSRVPTKKEAAINDAVLIINDPILIPMPTPVSILGAIVVPEGGYGTREAWMLAAVEAFRPWFAEDGETLPPVRISIGWPGGRGNKQNVLGQCWAASTVDDGIPALFVSPSQKDAVEVLETILHESIHAAGHYHHRSPFQKVARKFGFVNGGKVKTSREQSPDLYATLDEMAAALGPFPHSGVTSGGGLAGGDPKAPPVQSTRMLKVYCEEDGYTIRGTKKWLSVAVPECPLCSTLMTVDWK